MPKAIIALHGFFGSPKDFAPLQLENLRAPYIFNTDLCSLSTWARSFNGTISGTNILLGYSMGGRLALHCLLDNESRYHAAIILAAHPGLASICAREQRYRADFAWAQKIVTLPWEALLESWHKQPVLAGSPGPVRQAKDFDRLSLSLAMKRFSLGRQAYLVHRINALSLPILWLYAENEQANIAKIQLKNPLSQLIAMPGGHRFLFTQKDLVSAHINAFLYQPGLHNENNIIK